MCHAKVSEIPHDGHLQNIWGFPLHVELLLAKMALLEILLKF